MTYQKETFGELHINRTTFGAVCQVLFWIHSIVVGVPCVFLGFELFSRGTIQGLLPATALLLFWVGGAIILGIGAMLGTRVQVVRLMSDFQQETGRRP